MISMDKLDSYRDLNPGLLYLKCFLYFLSSTGFSHRSMNALTAYMKDTCNKIEQLNDGRPLHVTNQTMLGVTLSYYEETYLSYERSIEESIQFRGFQKKKS